MSRLLQSMSKVMLNVNAALGENGKSNVTWSGDVQHNSIVPFGFPIAPEASFTFSMNLEMLHKSLDITSNLLPIVSFWHREMEEKPFITAHTVEYRA